MSVLERITSAATSLFTRKPKLSPANRSRVVRDLSIFEQAVQHSAGRTPRDVADIIRMADSGYMTRLMDLANECRQKDTHLQAVLGVGEESIAALEWQIAVPENARAKDKRAAKFVDEVLRATPGLPILIAYLAGATYYSYDVNEIIWRKDGSSLIPDSFDHKAQRRFGFRTSDARLVLRDWDMGVDGIDFRAEWPNKFITAQPRYNGDAPHREGAARLLVWPALFRTWTIGDWLKTAELSWKPWRIGTYAKGKTNTEDRDGLEQALDQLSTNGWAAIPDGDSINIEWPKGSVSTKATHAELVNVLAQEESKAYLGQTETVQSSSSSGYGQAKVHDAVRKDLRESRAKYIAAVLTRDLITPLIRLNFGDSVIIPTFTFITDDEIDLQAFGVGVAALAKAGLRMPASWARDRGGIPEPKDDEETFGGAPPVDETDGPNGTDNNATPDDANADEPADAKKPTK